MKLILSKCNTVFRFQHYGFSTISTKLYQQNALTPQKYYQMLTQRLYKIQRHEIFHILKLNQSLILRPSHDYINHCCYRLLSFQKQMTFDQMILLMRVCYKNRVFNQVIIRHIENQIYIRMESSIAWRYTQSAVLAQKKLKQLLKQLQQQSKDHFNILTDEEVQSQLKEQQKLKQKEKKSVKENKLNTQGEKEDVEQQQQQHKQQEQTIKIAKDIEIAKQPQSIISLEKITEICYLLCALDVKQTKLLQLFTEYFFITKDQKSIRDMIIFTKVISHICEVNMLQYNKNKHRYLRRTVKSIYKYQSNYYQRCLPLITENIKNFKLTEIEQFLKYVSQFRLKKNVFKRQIFELFKAEVPQIYSSNAYNCYKYMKKVLEGNKKLSKQYQEIQKKFIETYKAPQQLPEIKEEEKEKVSQLIHI